jgi:hypothetical protein
MDWSYGSRGKATASQAESPEFKSQSHQKKKKESLKELTEQKLEGKENCQWCQFQDRASQKDIINFGS